MISPAAARSQGPGKAVADGGISRKRAAFMIYFYYYNQPVTSIWAGRTGPRPESRGIIRVFTSKGKPKLQTPE
jgi:hypothetical protein